jgi:hypothetical protein
MGNHTNCWELLAKAAKQIKPTDFAEYFELKRLVRSRDPKIRKDFQRRFANYYRLHVGGLTAAFKRRYLTLLVGHKSRGKKDPYTPLLLELYRFRRRKGDRVIHASFVSKLVAMHDESRPLFDKFVSRFFGLTVPSVGSVEFRIAGFVSNLERIGDTYKSWAKDRRFCRIVKTLFRKHPQLKTCHPSRVCDFLVWKVGDAGIK